MPSPKTLAPMRKIYKILICIVGLCLITNQLYLVIDFNNTFYFEKLVDTTSRIGRIGGLFLIFRNTLVSRAFPFFQLTILFLGIITIGALMKIMHWPYANELILTSIISIPTIYCLRLLVKKEKQLLDFLKLVWIISYACYTWISIQHLPYKIEMQMLESVLFLLVYFKFAYEQFQLPNNSKLQ